MDVTTLSRIIITAKDETGPATKSATSNLSGVEDSVGRLRGGLLGLASAATAIGLGAIVVQAIHAAAALDDMSEKTGVSVEKLSALQEVARIGGHDFEGVVTSLTKLSKTMVASQDATGSEAKALQTLGLSATDASGKLKDSGDFMLELAKKLNEFKDGTGKTAIAMALLGKAGAEQLPYLKDLAEYGELNTKVTAAQAAAAEEFEKSLKRLSTTKQDLVRVVSLEVLPVMQGFVNGLVAAGKETGGLRDQVRGLTADGSIRSWAEDAAIGLAVLADSLKLVVNLAATFVGSVNTILADLELIAAASNAPKFKITGALGFSKAEADAANADFESALKRRNATLEAANQRYVDLWEKSGIATEMAVRRGIAAANAMADLGKNSDQNDRAIARVAASTQKAALQFDSSTAKAEKMSEEMKLLLADYDKFSDLLVDATKHGAAYDKTLESLNRLYDAGIITLDQYVEAENRLFVSMSEVAKAAERLADEALKKLIAEEQKYIDLQAKQAQQATETLGTYADQTRRMELEVSLIGQSNLLRERALIIADGEIAKTQLRNAGDVEGLDLLQKQIDKRLQLAGIADQKQQSLEFQKGWLSAIDNVSHAGADFLVDFANHGSSAFKNLWASFKQWALRAFAEIAARKVVVSLVGALTGGVAGASGGADAGGGLGGISSLLGIGQQVSSINSGLGLMTTAATAFGTSAAGVALGLGTTAAELGAGAAAYGLAAEGVAAGAAALTTAGAGLVAMIPVVGWIAAAAIIAYAIFSKPGGGPKAGGNATTGNITGITGTDSSGTRYFTPDQSDADLQKTVDAATKGYADIVKALGLQAQDVGFALGFDTDPQGTAPNRTHAGTFVNGVQVYDSAQGDLGRDESKLQAQLVLESKRIIFAALQASMGDAPEYMKKLFAGVDVNTVTGEQIDEIVGMAQALKLIVDTFGEMGDKFAALDVDQMKDLVTQFGGLQTFLASAQFMNANFTTVADQRIKAEDQLNKAFEKLNVTMPTTHLGFMDLLAGIDLTTEAGRALYASVSGLAPAFIALNGTAEQAAQHIAELTAQIHQFNRDNMLTDDQRLIEDTAALNASFAALGVAVPATHAEFLTLIGTLGLTQEDALKLSQLYVLVHGTAQQAAEAETALADARRDAIASAEELYRSKFFTGPEQAAARIAAAWTKVHQAWNQMGSQLLELGLDHIPTTNQGFRDLIESVKAMGPEGQALYDTLILLAPTIFDLNEGIDELGGTASASAEEMKRLRQSIRDFLDSLKIGDLSPLTPEQKLSEAQQQYLTLLQKAQGGDADALARLPQAAQAYLDIARDFYASSQQYTDIFNSVITALEQLAAEPVVTEPTKDGPDLGPLNAVLPTGKRIASDDDIERLADRIIDGLRQHARETVEATQRSGSRIAGSIDETSRKTPRGTR